MPDRVLHVGIWTSDRFLGLGGEDYSRGDTLRLLFVRLVSATDDLGNVECSPAQLSIYMARQVSRQQAQNWLQELSTTDLVRPYAVSGKHFLHIPRSRQRLRSLKKTHPRPPEDIEDKELREALDRQATDAGASNDSQSPANGRTNDSQLTASRAAGIDLNRTDLDLNRTESNRSGAGDDPEPQRGNGPEKLQTVLKKLTGKTKPGPTAHAETVRRQAAAAVASGNGSKPPAPPPSAPVWSCSERGIVNRGMELGKPAFTGESRDAYRERLIAWEKTLPETQRRG